MPILIIHLPEEHKAAIDEHWIRLELGPHGWLVTGSLGDLWGLPIGPSKCGYLPGLETVEAKAIAAAIGQGVGEVFVEG